MNLASLRIITPEIKRSVQFFEKITGFSAHWYTEDFAEITTGTCNLAIGSTSTMSLFGKDLTSPGNNNSVIIEFLVENVDEQYNNIKDLLSEIVQQPTTMPWGNRSLLFRDPDGNLINFFTPVTPEAIKKHI
ncbi:VOC family protein [Pedobacter cryoconitis]|uniref:Glyoxalase/bleomycin resistance protein/dioxygenase superfamily protein n=1 Tax=Pedobacter cryoconitis TaxID=188932 RepID=A0A327SNM7_9SPHI|nr:VOC family protein [Pedobacter cryoconitis]RAJ27297.1 glyoxalase/bleomycin resistance protein/dioxygenase superfamily protein [Pedobacter cryoconitis]